MTQTHHFVEAFGLSKVFNDFWGRPRIAAVQDVSFAVGPGEVLGFVGPNGSGKSTTIKMIVGLLRPTQGSIKIFDHAPDHTRTKNRVGYLPEENCLYNYLTARETLAFFGSLFALPKSECRRRADQLLEMVGLAHAADRRLAEFSKGMTRRIGIAQALINDPDLVILDEPTAGLDPLGCRRIKELIRALAARKKALIISSHLLADIEDVCDRILIMYGGQIRAQGAVHDLLRLDDRTQITSPRLDAETVAQVMAVLHQSVSPDAIQIQHPAMTLEEYFIQVVQQARRDNLRTQGAEEQEGVPSYLAGGSGEPATGEALLRRLSAQEDIVDASRSASSHTAAAAPPAVDVERLAALAPGTPAPTSAVATERNASSPSQGNVDSMTEG